MPECSRGGTSAVSSKPGRKRGVGRCGVSVVRRLVGVMVRSAYLLNCQCDCCYVPSAKIRC